MYKILYINATLELHLLLDIHTFVFAQSIHDVYMSRLKTVFIPIYIISNVKKNAWKLFVEI